MTVRKRSEKWMVDIDFTFPDGKKKRIRKLSPIQTKRGAEQYEREIRQALADGTYQKRKEDKKEVPRFKEFAEDFISLYAESNNKHSEIMTKKSILKNHLIPGFGEMRLDQIGMKQIDLYKALKKRDGLALKTINNHLAVLRKLLVVAEDYGEISSTPKVNWQKFPAPDFDFLDSDEAKKLVEAAKGMWRDMIILVLYTGLRHGEVLELRGKDIFPEFNVLKVSRGYYRGHIDLPKGGRARDIRLHPSALEVLKRRKKQPEALIFSDKQGKHLTSEQCKWPIWKACDKAGLRRIRWHVLRHTFASQLVMQGAPLKSVQELLGHSSMQMTMRYAHLSPKAVQEAVNLLPVYGTIAAQKNGELDNPPLLQEKIGVD